MSIKQNSELPVFKLLRIRLDNEPSLTVPLGSDVVRLLLKNDHNAFILVGNFKFEFWTVVVNIFSVRRSG
jgi:hypothetical protein